MHSSRSLAITQSWTTDSNMVMQGSAISADLDGRGGSQFLTAAYQAIIAFAPSGEELWRFDTDVRFMTCPAILERPGEPALIYAADMSHSPSTLSCIDGLGNVVWQTETGQVFWVSPALCDLNSHGSMSVIQGDSDGVLRAWDALTGNPIWEQQIDGICGSPAVGDLGGDGVAEIAITTSTGKLFILSAEGEITNEVVLGGTVFDPVGEYAAYRICSPVIFFNIEGQPRIATSVQEPGSRRFVCLDAKGQTVWECPTDGGVASTISVADFNGDGRTDIFAATQTGRLYRWDEDGRVIWDIDTQGFCYAPGAIADINGDGKLEYLLCTELGTVLVFDQAGDMVFRHQLDSRRTHRCTPALGTNPEGNLAFGVTGGDAGRFYCFDLPAAAGAQIEWSTVRGDLRMDGTCAATPPKERISMIPENLRWDSVFTSDELIFRVTNPSPGTSPLQAECSVVAPDGTRHGSAGVIVGGEGILKMPINITTPGSYLFHWSANDSTGEHQTSDSADVYLTPFANDQAIAERAILVIDSADLPKSNAGIGALLRSESEQIKQQAVELNSRQTAAPGSSRDSVLQVVDNTRDLTERASRALELAELAPDVAAQSPNAVILPFEGHTWENIGVDAELPTEVNLPLKIKRRCVTGEHEPVSIKLLNVSPREAVVEAKIETPQGGPLVTPHEVKPVPTNPDHDTVAWDPIVPLDGGDSVTIPSFETREIWLDIDATHAKAGTHKVAITFGTYDSETSAEITVEVIPFEMAGYDAMRLCMWASYVANAVPDLLAHGNTVFPTGAPPATQNGSGLDVDFTALDEFVALLEGHDVFLLLTGVPQLGTEWEDESYEALLADYLEQVMAHLEKKQIPEEHVGLYTWDEVGGHGWEAVRRYVAFGRKALKARPGVKIYINGGGDLPMFEELAEIAGIWSPAFFMLDEDTPVMNYLRNTDAKMWSYNCSMMYARPLGWNIKASNIVGEYRMQAVFAAINGGTGIGYWSYNIGPSMWEPAHPEYPITYQTEPSGHVTASRRLEAIRESVDDTRILVALREKLNDDSTNQAAKSKINHLLGVTLPALADKSLAEMHLGAPRYQLDDTNDDEMVDSFRRSLLDCVEAVIA